MRLTISAIALSLALFGPGSHAQTQTPQSDASTAPSAGNSGVGIAGAPGSKSGPAEKAGNTTGSAQQNPTTQQQDPANVKGLPGNKSGPAVKPPERQ